AMGGRGGAAAARRRAVIESGGVRTEVTIGAVGKHMAVNSLAVLATLRALGIPDWTAALSSLSTFQALTGRGATTSVGLPGGQVTVIDESYNANPASMRAALAALADRPVEGGRRIVVLADMLELGAHAADIHRSLAPALETLADAQVHLVGENMAALFEAVQGRLPAVQHWESTDALRPILLADLRPGDVLLLKGSNGMDLASVVKALQATQA